MLVCSNAFEWKYSKNSACFEYLTKNIYVKNYSNIFCFAYTKNKIDMDSGLTLFDA